VKSSRYSSEWHSEHILERSGWGKVIKEKEVGFAKERGGRGEKSRAVIQFEQQRRKKSARLRGAQGKGSRGTCGQETQGLIGRAIAEGASWQKTPKVEKILLIACGGNADTLEHPSRKKEVRKQSP